MRVLLVAATLTEVEPLVAKFNCRTLGKNKNLLTSAKSSLDILICGIGMVSAASYTAFQLAKSNYDLAINVGIAGSFDRQIKIGELVYIKEDSIAWQGAETENGFEDIFDIRLHQLNDFPYTQGWIACHTDLSVYPGLQNLVQVRAITVNKVNGTEKSIAEISKQYRASVESMEGAGFMFACEVAQVPYLQIRAISNFVEKRNKANWNIPLAISELNKSIARSLDAILAV